MMQAAIPCDQHVPPTVVEQQKHREASERAGAAMAFDFVTRFNEVAGAASVVAGAISQVTKRYLRGTDPIKTLTLPGRNCAVLTEHMLSSPVSYHSIERVHTVMSRSEENVMAKLLLVGSAAVLSFAMPATANAQSSWHEDRHERLDDVHGDVHEDLREEHADAHDQGLNRWQHSRVHRNLQDRHEDADYALELEHQRRDMRSRWRRQYQNYGYQEYRYRGYNYPRYQRQSGFSIYYGN